MLLRPKRGLEQLGSVRQGLGDPAPPPGRACKGAPYARREEYPFAPVLGSIIANAELDGRLLVDGWCGSGLGIPEASIGVAWVGHDLDLAAGFRRHEATIDDDFDFSGSAMAMWGVSVVNLDVATVLDKRDGTPAEKSAQSVCTMVVPFVGGDHFFHMGNVRVTLPVTRDTSEAGTVRVMVGVDGHCMSIAFCGLAFVFGRASSARSASRRRCPSNRAADALRGVRYHLGTASCGDEGTMGTPTPAG